MKRLLVLPALALAAPLSAAVVINSLEYNYTQNFSTLPSSGTTLTWENNVTLPGWYRWYDGDTVPPGRDVSIQASGAVGSGVASESGFINVGQNESTDRALVLRRLNTPEGALGMVFQNATGGTITSFTVGYTGEQWRRHNNNNGAASALYFEYAIVPEHDPATFNILTDYTWTRVSTLTFVSPNISGGNTGLNGDSSINRTVLSPVTITAAVPAGYYIAIRWYQNQLDTNGNSGSYHALGVDSMTFSAIVEIPEPATYAAMLGVAVLGLALVRRRRA